MPPPRRRFHPVGAVVLLAILAAFIIAILDPFIPQSRKDTRPDEARRAFESGQYQEAVRVYEALLHDRPADAESRLFLGWARYRMGDFAAARRDFQRALKEDPASIDALVGLGYAELHVSTPDVAATLFRQALEKDPKRTDALRGIVLAGRRPGAAAWVVQESARAAQRLEAPASGSRSDEILLPGTEKRRRPAAGGTPERVRFRSGRDYLEQQGEDGTWRPLFIKAMDLGAALPGKFPAEFPTEEATYREWLGIMAAHGFNAVRLYTLLPPQFYRALDDHNRQAGARPIYLIQGVWAELPRENDFSDPTFEEEFRREAARVADAVHGNLALGPMHGHAWGIYDRDVSPHLLAWLLGREWEPFAVRDFNARYPTRNAWTGTWFTVAGGQAMEVWLAQMCDFVAAHQILHYGHLVPISFVNWPTLDPLQHPTEATHEEENAWRVRKGLKPDTKPRSWWEEDVITLDPTKIAATAANPAGYFASYHIYPYYPDFMNHEYGDAHDAHGVNRYAGYLRALKQHHGELPIFVAEFGVPSSRGIAHLHPEGWHHGGHDERQMNRINGHLFVTIHAEKYAGGALFEFLDEWFKVSWSVAEFEVPEERRRMWANPQNPEKVFGLVAARPGSLALMVDGKADDWRRMPVYVGE